MSTKIVSTSSALGIALVLTSSWVGQAQAFVYTNGTTTFNLTNFGSGFVGTCADLGVYGSGVYGAGSTYDAWTGCGLQDTRFKASTAVTSQAVLRTATEQVTGLISGRMQSLHNPKMRGAHKKATKASGKHMLGSNGLSSGHEDGVDGWFNTAWSHARNNQSSVNFSGDLVTAMAGIDYPMTEGIRAGVGVGYESSGISTRVNQGHVNGRGATFVPYLAFDHDNWLMADLQVGYTKLDYSLKRRDPAATNVVYMVEGDMNAHRWFGAFNLNANRDYRHFVFGGKAGLLWAEEHQNSFRDTTGYLTAARQVNLGRASLGLDIDYDTQYMIRPFIGANAVWDFDQYSVTSNTRAGLAQDGVAVIRAGQESVTNDEFAVIYSAGLRFHQNKAFNAVVRGSTEQHRKHYRNDSVMLDINSSF